MEKDSVTSEMFIERYDGVKSLLVGKIGRIADIAGCDKVRFWNAVAGRIKSPDLLGPIYWAMEQVVKEEMEKITESYK